MAEQSTENSIMEFAKLVVGAKFSTTMKSIFTDPGTHSLYDLLSNFLNYLFYNIYSIPNLPDNKILIIKPETLFGKIPSCNVILPCMKSSISLSRLYKEEPTRVFLVTDPLNLINGESAHKLVCLSALDASKTTKKDGILRPGNIENITNIGKNTTVSATNTSDCPMYHATDYESKYGLKLYNYSGYGDIVAYMLTDKANAKVDKDAARTILRQLTKYSLLRDRYSKRSGVIQTYFNPYVTPGFPMCSLEPAIEANTDDATDITALNVFGYVTNVVHNFTANSWNTTIEYGGAYFTDEEVPDAFPVIEDAYKNPTEQYKKIFGSDCKSYDMSTIATDLKDKIEESTSITDAYKTIRREATKLEDYLSGVAENATQASEGNIMTLKGSYFRENVQKIVLQYSKKVFNQKAAFFTSEVR